MRQLVNSWVEAGSKPRPKKIKLWDKNAALEKLMRHLGPYESDNTQKAPVVHIHVALV